MSRYIDAVKAAEIVSERHNIPLYELVDTFAEVPTADVKEVKHGHWSSFPAYKNNYTDMCYRCTECGCVDMDPTNFCPSCGARMDEEVKE